MHRLRCIVLVQGEYDVRAHRLRRELADDDFSHDSAAVDENVDRQAVDSVLIAQRAGVDDDRIDQVMSAAKLRGLPRVLEHVNPDDLQTRGPYLRCSALMRGASSLHGGHHVAKKFR